MLLEHIIRRARLQTFNRRLFANRAGNQDERRVRTFFLCQGHRLQTRERRQMIIRNDDVEMSALPTPAVNAARSPTRVDLRVDTVLLEQRADQLGKIRLVFQMQDVQAFLHRITAMDSLRLIKQQMLRHNKIKRLIKQRLSTVDICAAFG